MVLLENDYKGFNFGDSNTMFYRLIQGLNLSPTEAYVFRYIYDQCLSQGFCDRSLNAMLKKLQVKISKPTLNTALKKILNHGLIRKDSVYTLTSDTTALTTDQQENKIMLPAVIETPQTTETNEPVKPVKKTKKPTGFVIPTTEQVTECMRDALTKIFKDGLQDAYVTDQVTQFMEYWEGNNWTDSKGHKVKSLKGRIATWTRNIAREYNLDVKPYQITAPDVNAIVSEIFAVFEPMQFRKDWRNERIDNLVEEQARAFYSICVSKNWHFENNVKTWQEALHLFIAMPKNKLRFLNPNYQPFTGWETEYRNELIGGAKKIDPISEKGLETVKDIFSILDEKDAEEKARIEQHKKDIIQ